MAKRTASTELATAKSLELHPEIEFAELYSRVISKLFDLKCFKVLNDVKSSLRAIRELKHIPADRKRKCIFRNVVYTKPAVRCAYMYAYSVLHSCMVYFEFSTFFTKYGSVLRPATWETLKLCCLGGGPGTEAVAIGKAINDFNADGKSLLEFTITVVDKHSHWKRDASAVINAVHDVFNLLDSKKIIIHTDFIKADLLKPLTKKLREKIKEANIVTIVKLGSDIREKSAVECNLEIQHMVKNVTDCMAESSCLFMLDSAGGNIFHGMMNVLTNYDTSCKVQKSLHKEYCLDVKTIQKMEDLLKSKEDARTILPTVRSKVSSCFWIKNTLEIARYPLVSGLKTLSKSKEEIIKVQEKEENIKKKSDLNTSSESSK